MMVFINLIKQLKKYTEYLKEKEKLPFPEMLRKFRQLMYNLLMELV